MRARLWLDGAHRGSWNMAFDAAMLEQAAFDRSVILRVYTWSRPTVSLGYFQSFADFQAIDSLKTLDCVRRQTGGGAILHDREWTYSIAVPETGRAKGHSEHLYRAVHDAVVARLRPHGYALSRWSEREDASLVSGANKSFMCFERRSEVDLVWGKRKILGSAQRRTEHGLLQHGSLLLNASSYFPSLRGLLDRQECDELPGLITRKQSVGSSEFETGTGEITLKDFVEALRHGIDNPTALDWTSDEPTTECLERAKHIEAERFASPDWNRSPRR